MVTVVAARETPGTTLSDHAEVVPDSKLSVKRDHPPQPLMKLVIVAEKGRLLVAALEAGIVTSTVPQGSGSHP
jgi:hypothetical protein